jgi:protein-disulfide isomerase
MQHSSVRPGGQFPGPTASSGQPAAGPVLRAAVAAGQVQVEYRMRSFLGPESVRAVAALGAAADEGRFEQLRERLFATQPQEHTGGYTVAQLLAAGRAVGLTSSAYQQAVRQQTYARWARQVDDQASRDADVGTPELRLDGRVLTSAVVLDPAALTAALR